MIIEVSGVVYWLNINGSSVIYHCGIRWHCYHGSHNGKFSHYCLEYCWILLAVFCVYLIVTLKPINYFATILLCAFWKQKLIYPVISNNSVRVSNGILCILPIFNTVANLVPYTKCTVEEADISLSWNHLVLHFIYRSLRKKWNTMLIGQSRALAWTVPWTRMYKSL